VQRDHDGIKKNLLVRKELLIVIPMLLRNTTAFELVDSLITLIQNTKNYWKLNFRRLIKPQWLKNIQCSHI